MSTKSQSPGPKPTTTTSRKPRNKIQETEKLGGAGRAGSAGGIILEKGLRSSKKNTGAMSSSTTAAKVASPAANTSTMGKDGAATATGPTRQRRRPRKLNKEPASQEGADVKGSSGAAAMETPAASTTELEALKSRVRGLEAKVEELYKSGAIDARTGRSPRRRGKGRKASTTQQQSMPTPSAAPEAGQGYEQADEEEADEELGRLEDELEVARRDLESYRPRNERTSSAETEYIEEIPRSGEGVPVDDTTFESGDRQITLSGSYRIPLPSSVSMKDVKNIQSGVSAAQNVARNFMEQRRAQQAMQDPSGASSPRSSANTTTPKPSRKASATAASTSTALTKDDGKGQTWSEWFGGYSMAISKAVKNIEAEAAIEAQKAGTPGPAGPKQAGRTASAPTTKPTTKTTGKSTAATGASKSPAASTKRPPARGKTGGLSSEQVKGLMG